MKVKESNYKYFTNTERLNLTLAAMAKNDDAERDILFRTCPMHTYRSMDSAFTTSLDAVFIIGLVFSEMIAACYIQITTNMAVISINHYSDKAGESFHSTPENNYKFFDSLSNNFAELKAIYDGLVDFCTEVQINHEDILRLLKIHEKYHSFDEYLTKACKENASLREQVKTIFLQEWRA